MRKTVSKEHWEEMLWAGELDDGALASIHVHYGMGWCYLSLRVTDEPHFKYKTKTAYVGWWQQPYELRHGAVMSFLNKANQVRKSFSEVTEKAELEFRRIHPALTEWMSAEAYPDGSARQPASLIVIMEDGLWKGCVNDRDQGRSLWASATTLEGLLRALDAHLQDGTGEWRVSRQAGSQGPRKGQKK